MHRRITSMVAVAALCVTGGGLEASTHTQPAVAASSRASAVNTWITNLDTAQRLSPQAPLAMSRRATSASSTIVVDPTRRYQSMQGFGAAMTGASGHVLTKDLDPRDADAAMRALFSPTQGIGLSMLRNPMGASDESPTHYSYDDMPKGHTDPTLAHFSVAKDALDVLPLVRQAQRLNPRLSTIASPWSPPGWMKTSDSLVGGTLQPRYYAAYAHYFVKYLKASAAAGVSTRWVTTQNEPLYSPSDYPGMFMSASEQQTFVSKYLGPALRRAGLRQQVMTYDHNWDRPSYPEQVLSDPAASRYVAGTAWHCYGGGPVAQTLTHNHFPDSGTWLTECSGGTWQGTQQQAWDASIENVIEGPRNWGQSVVLWNLALDQDMGPHLGGCGTCRGLVTVDSRTRSWTPTLDYWALGQASKFVRPGAVRVASSIPTAFNVRNVAYINPDGSDVLVAYNRTDTAQKFSVRIGAESFTTTLAAHAAGTYVWRTAGHTRPVSANRLGQVDLPLGRLASGQHRTVTVGRDEIAAMTQLRVGNRWVSYSLPATSQINPGVKYTPLDRHGWTAAAVSEDTTSSTDGSPAHMLDGKLATRWSTGHGVQQGDWFTVDAGRSVRFDRIVMASPNSPTDVPSRVEVQVSNDGHTFTPIWKGNTGTGQTTVDVPGTSARYVKVVSGSSSGSWWSVDEFNLALATGARSKPTRGPGVIAASGRLGAARLTARYNATARIVVQALSLGNGHSLTYTLPPRAASTVVNGA